MTRFNNLRTDLALLAMRLMVGSVFLFHGSQKLFGAFDGPGLEGFAGYLESLGLPAPGAQALLAALTEFVGGLAFVTGFGQRLLAAPLVITMLVAGLLAHSGFDASQGGGEYALTLAVVTAGLGLLGPGDLVVKPSRDQLAGGPALA